MRLVHPTWGKKIEIKENAVNVIYIENEKDFYKCVYEFCIQANGGEGTFILSKDLKELSVSKNIDIVTDVLNIELNDKKLLTRLYAKLKEFAVDDEDYLATN
ncbi:MAG: type II-A CRISPR-associated protein Csn2, partial [Lachnospiraceae bacterium]|nr:type II-A CRISPR-associated protein Csn2 [Lachnospiraceae bacterium]